MGFEVVFQRTLINYVHTLNQTVIKGLAIFSFILLAAASCSKQAETPKNIIKEDMYIDLMIEMQLLKVYQLQSKIDSTQVDSLMQAIFQQYDITKQQFKQSHQFYQNQLKNHDKRIETAIDRLRKDNFRQPDSTRSDTVKAKP